MLLLCLASSEVYHMGGGALALLVLFVACLFFNLRQLVSIPSRDVTLES